eukprot:TRINITY_DN25776_c0_g2_i1.p1 TRINITY_DN25776_c0_g2~~TRINITY_DN25776_c0_g2_i1.p1  ORF type:complete len:200 (-),score=54.79 TRINITY_DN25776_c0_g2_i1:296-895(-)
MVPTARLPRNVSAGQRPVSAPWRSRVCLVALATTAAVFFAGADWRRPSSTAAVAFVAGGCPTSRAPDAYAQGRYRGRIARGAVTECEGEAALDEAIEKTKSDGNIFVVCYSTTWCGPCKLMDPKVQELSEVFAEKASFSKVIGDKEGNDGKKIMRREGVRTVPLYQIYKDGEKVGSVAGANFEDLKNELETHTGLKYQG